MGILASVPTGLSGTRHQLTDKQLAILTFALTAARPERVDHGMCTGLDETGNDIARSLGVPTHGYPADDVSLRWRSICQVDVMHPPQRAPVRTRHIATITSQLIVVPTTRTQQWRGSGTWIAIRTAWALHRPVHAIFPGEDEIWENFQPADLERTRA